MPGKLVVQIIVTKLLTEEGKKTRNIKPVNLIKEKRDGGIKGRACADGSRICRYLKYDETVLSSIVSLVTIKTHILFKINFLTMLKFIQNIIIIINSHNNWISLYCFLH